MHSPQNIFLTHPLPSTSSRRRRNQPWPRLNLQPTLKLATFNIRSASSITHLYNKPEILKHLIHDHKIDILCLTETWLHPDTLPAVINSLLPPSFNISHCPRPQGGGGGVGFIFNNKISAQNVTLPKYSSFEIQCLSFTARPPTNSFIVHNHRLLIPYSIYIVLRPPPKLPSFLNSPHFLKISFHPLPNSSSPATLIFMLTTLWLPMFHLS